MTPGTTTPYPVAARALLRDTLLDAVRAELRAGDWGEVTMAQVARGAGVSRQTLYNEFGSRDELALAFVLREGDRFLVAVSGAVREHAADPAAALEAAFAVFLDAAENDPVIRSALRPDGEHPGLLAQVTTHGRPLVAHAAEQLTAVLVATWPQAATADAALLAECLVRLAISYATLPGGPTAMTAASVTTLLAPYVEQILADPQTS